MVGVLTRHRDGVGGGWHKSIGYFSRLLVSRNKYLELVIGLCWLDEILGPEMLEP